MSQSWEFHHRAGNSITEPQPALGRSLLRAHHGCTAKFPGGMKKREKQCAAGNRKPGMHTALMEFAWTSAWTGVAPKGGHEGGHAGGRNAPDIPQGQYPGACPGKILGKPNGKWLKIPHQNAFLSTAPGLLQGGPLRLQAGAQEGHPQPRGWDILDAHIPPYLRDQPH